jgi:hypothetical protein
MSTRSLTTFFETFKDEEKGKTIKREIATIYRQSDGYPSGMGKDLAEFLVKGKLVNGISIGSAKENQIQFNGVECLAAQVVAAFKTGVGGIYLQRANRNCGEDYRYHIIGDFDSKKITMKVFEVGYMKGNKYIDKAKCVFSGSPQEFLESKLLKEE